jgi:8-oxo-dGTP pyrophosphatase MutT (NUDIX family)/predicted nucleotidyltransferase/GNAT superfamily N-acetyltransferase
MRAREFTEPGAAGCILRAADTGRWCLQQRSDTVSDPGVWSTWGGGRKSGESLEQCVRRELAEEGGYTGSLRLEPLMMNQRYATYIGHVPHEFEPSINNEVKDWCWVERDQLPNPLHPGLEQALMKLDENFTNNQSWKSNVVNAIRKALPMAQEIWFHGSRAIGRHRPDSDTDILVVVPDDVVGDDYIGAVRTLQKVSNQFDNYDIQPTKYSSNIYQIAQEEGQLLWSATNENFADGQSKKITFNTQKGKNKFATTMMVNNAPVGVYQYNADTGRSIAEIYPEYKGQGLGKLLVLNAIYTAAKLGLDFVEDESRTAEYDNVLDSLSGNGYIVDDDGYWYVTDQGEQYLKQSLKQGVAENFADGKNPGRKGLSRRVGIPKKASLTQLQKIASSSTGERRRMAQWQLNMRRGKARKNK